MFQHTHKCSGGNCRICRITTDDVYYSGEFLYPLIVNTGDTVTSILQKINQKIDSGISITTGSLVEGTGISFLGNPRNRLVGSGNLTVEIDIASGTGIDITGNTITNTAPDQVVTITGSGSATVTGTYPNFDIYADEGIIYQAGPGIDITGDTISNTGVITETDPTVPSWVKSITQTDIDNWNTGSEGEIVSAAFTGNNTKTLTLTASDGGTVTASFQDNNTEYSAGLGIDITGTVISNTGVVSETDPTVPTWVKNISQTDIDNWNSAFDESIQSVSFNPVTGDLTLTREDSTTLTANLDGRYLQIVDLQEEVEDIVGALIEAGTGISVVYDDAAGTLSITNTSPDQVVSITGTGATTVTGTYPNFTIDSDNTEYTAGTGIDITGTVISNTGIVTETDPTVPVWVKNITQANITQWDAAEQNVPSDWDETNPASDAFIFNKPTLNFGDYYTKVELQTAGQSQVNWGNITNAPSFIELTSLSATAPISYNSATGNFSIAQATSTTDGFLSSTDWTTFNNKANAFTTGNVIAGTGVTFTGTGANRLFGTGDLTISVDPIDLSGYVPTTRTLTIQGVARDLSQDREWSFTTTDVPEGTNLYFTTTRARNSISAGNGIAYDPLTGVVSNTAQDQVVSITAGSNIVVTGTYPNFTIAANLSDYYTITQLQTSGSSSVHWDNITNTPDFLLLDDLSATGPISYNSTTGNFSISQSSSTTDGYLSSVDWNTFNDKADSFSTGDIVAGTGVTLTGSGLGRLFGSGTLTINATPTDLSGYVPTSRTLTINGTAFDLSANRSWTIPVADGSETIINAGTGVTVTGSGTSTTPYVISSPYQTLTWNNTTKTISISDGNSQVLTGLVSTDLPITNSYGINIGGDLSTGLSIGIDTTVVDLRYLRKDVDDSNGVNKLTLGSLEVGPTEITGSLTLGSVATGPDTNNFLTIDPSTGMVEQTPLSIEIPDLNIADGAGAQQFGVDLVTEDLKFTGGGDTTVSFNAATNLVTITSIPGSGTGGAVTSFNGRTGGVVSVVGDYNTSQVTETTNLYFTEPRVLSTPLTGYTTLAGTISASDTILEAFGKAQAQITARVPTSRTITINGTAGRTVVGGATQNLTANRTWSVDLAEAGTVGTYTKVTTDAYGRVISGTTLQTSDLPISAGSGIAISPTGVISNSAQDQTVTITGTGLTNVTGTYPNFTVDTTLIAGGGINITGNTISATATTPNLQQVTDVGNTTNDTMVVTGFSEFTNYTSRGADIRVVSPVGGWSRSHTAGITDGTSDIGLISFGGFGGSTSVNYGYLSSKLSSAYVNADLKFIDGKVGINVGGTIIPTYNLQVNGNALISDLSGTGARMVIAEANGALSTQTLPNLGDYVPITRVLIAGNGLTGGGDLSADRTFTLGTPSSITATSTNSVTTTSHTHELAVNSVVTAKILNSNVTLAKIQNIPTQTLLGRYAAGTGVTQTITLGTGLALNTSGVLSATNTTAGTVTSVSSTVGGTALSVVVTTPTTTPNLAFNWEGTASQYVTGTGALATFPNIPQGTVTSITIGNGLTGTSPITSAGTITLGTPSNITLSSTNSVTAGSHTHAFVLGGTTSQYLRGDGTLATFPAIPNVNDGQLTLATSGIATGSSSFTANQSTNSTFTVDVPGTNLGSSLVGSDLTITSSTGTNTSVDLSSILPTDNYRSDYIFSRVVSSADLNTALPSGGYVASYSTLGWATNGAPGFTYGGVIGFSQQSTDGLGLQLQYDIGHNGGNGAGRLAFRTIAGTAPAIFNPWKEIATQDWVGTQLHAPVTLAGQNYLSLSGQTITANPIGLNTTNTTGTLPVSKGGSGATTLTGYLKGNGTSAFTAVATIPYSDISGTPTIPTVNNGTLTLSTGTGLAGSGTFTANQAVNSTFNVAAASGYVIPTTTQVSNWNTAYGWGNHALAGYEVQTNKATSLLSPNNTTYPTTQAVADAIGSIPAPVETDPIYTASIPIQMMYKGTLGVVDLDTVIETGFYVQGSNADATSGANYPAPRAGILSVKRPHPSHIEQTYKVYLNNITYTRYCYTGTWTTWKRLVTDGFVSLDPLEVNTVVNPNQYAGDLNSLTSLSRFSFTTGVANKPTFLTAGGIADNGNYNVAGSDYSSQTVLGWGEDQFGYRTRQAGTWGTWYQVASRQWVNSQGFLTSVPNLQQVTDVSPKTTNIIQIKGQGGIDPGDTNGLTLAATPGSQASMSFDGNSFLQVAPTQVVIVAPNSPNTGMSASGTNLQLIANGLTQLLMNGASNISQFNTRVKGLNAIDQDDFITLAQLPTVPSINDYVSLDPLAANTFQPGTQFTTDLDLVNSNSQFTYNTTVTNKPAFSSAGGILTSSTYNNGNSLFSGQTALGWGQDDQFGWRRRYLGIWGPWVQGASRDWVISQGYTNNTGTVTSVSAGNGMTFSTITGIGSVTLGTPGTITLGSTNAVQANSHTHAFTPGGTTAQYIRGNGTLATFPAIPTATDYVTTNSSQSGLQGNKSWTGLHTFSNQVRVGTGTTTEPLTVGTAASGSVARFIYDNSDNLTSGIRLQGKNVASSNYYADFGLNAESSIAGIGFGTTGASLPIGQTGSTNMGMWVNTLNDLFSGRHMYVGFKLFIPTLANPTPQMLTIGSTGEVLTQSIPGASDFITTNTTQTGLTGDKTTTGAWHFRLREDVWYNDASLNNRLYFSSIAGSNGILLKMAAAGQQMQIRDVTNNIVAYISGDNGAIQSDSLAGTGTRMVVANTDGVLGVQTIPVSGVTSVSAGNGMNFTTITSTGAVTLGTPGSITATSTNAVTATSHTHALANNSITTAKILDGNVTFPKIEAMPAFTLLGNNTAVVDSPKPIGIGTGLQINGTTGDLEAINTGGWSDTIGYEYEGNSDGTAKGLDTKGGYATRAHTFITNSNVPIDVENCIFIGNVNTTLSLPDPADYIHRVLTITNSGQGNLTLITNIPIINSALAATINVLYPMYYAGGGGVEVPESWIRVQSIYNPVTTSYRWIVIQKG